MKMHLRWFLEDGKNFYKSGTYISNKGRAWVLETDIQGSGQDLPLYSYVI